MDAWVWIVIVAAVLLLLVVAYWAVLARRRRELEQGFGPEYERTLEYEGSRRAADAELRERLRRHDQYEIRALDRDERYVFARKWDGVQARFVDQPTEAVGGADRLIQEVMRARGYPVDAIEQRADDLSVDHPTVVDNYRRGHALAERSSADHGTTEELRQAMVHYRSLFEDLVGVGQGGRA